MSAIQRQPLIVVKRAWEEEAPIAELVSYIQDDDGNSRKIVNFVPIDDGTRGIEHLLMRTMIKYRDHVHEAELLDAEVFRDFTKCLAGSTLRYWNHIIGDYRQSQRTNEAFVEACDRLRDKVCGESNMGDTQIYWLGHGIKKPRQMSPRDFHNRFEEIVDCTSMLEGNFNQPNEHEIKTWFYNAFPNSYKHTFQKAGLKVDDKTIEEITDYFQGLHTFESQFGELKEEKKRKKNDQDDKDQSRTSTKKQRGRDRSFQHRDDRRGNRDDRKPKWNGKCPLHPEKSHTWGDCFSNPESRNFRPQYGSNSRRDGGGGDKRGGSNRSNGGNRSSKGRNERSDAHYHEDEESSRKNNNNRGGRNNRRSDRSSRDDDDGSVVDTHHAEAKKQLDVYTSAIFDS